MVSTEGRQAVQNNSPGESGARVPGRCGGRPCRGEGVRQAWSPITFQPLTPLGAVVAALYLSRSHTLSL